MKLLEIGLQTLLIITFFSGLTILLINTTFGQENAIGTEVNINKVSSTLQALKNDNEIPIINITNPAYPPTTTTGKILIEGTASDMDSGISNVSVVAHTFPFDGNFNVRLASKPMPVSNNNWSKWSFPLIINDTGAYRVVIEARDNAGNVNYAETTINAVSVNNTLLDSAEPRIAFVRPTFTEAAYQDHGFYNFYFKYGFPDFGKNITTDLDMLTVKTPKSVSEFPGNDLRHLTNLTSLIPINGTELGDVSQNFFPVPQKFWLPFIDHANNVLPNAELTVIRDEDVHDGHIFYKSRTANAYDVLLLFHNEYATQAEYDNLRQFVSNGGTIVFIDANALYAEVRYDRNNNTISLVKGHDWEYDSESATRSVPERWYNESKEWIGSNYLAINANVTFTNNPFNYTHFEEQFVNNPNAKIIIDYGVKFPQDFIDLYEKKETLPPELKREDIPIDKIKVATYSMEYGKGKVIMTSLSARLLANDERFMEFFDRLLMEQYKN